MAWGKQMLIKQLKVVDKLKARVKESGTLIQVPKTFLFQTQVKYLGYDVHPNRIQMNPKYRKRIWKLFIFLTKW